MITAHGGALGTGRNTQRYFDAILNGTIVSDVIEVDIWGKKDNLYLSHLPSIFPKKKIPLKYALELARDKKLLINCDIKKSGIFIAVRDLAIELGATDSLLYTGATHAEHIQHLTVGMVYANDSFFSSAGLRFTTENVPALKKYVDSFGNPRLKGINANYKHVSDEFLKACKDNDLGVSLYTVDDREAFDKYMTFGLDNITTNHPDWAVRG